MGKNGRLFVEWLKKTFKNPSEFPIVPKQEAEKVVNMWFRVNLYSQEATIPYLPEACRQVLNDASLWIYHPLAVLILRELGNCRKLTPKYAAVLLDRTPYAIHRFGGAEDGYTLTHNVRAVLGSSRKNVPIVLVFVEQLLVMESLGLDDRRWEALCVVGEIRELYGADVILKDLREKIVKELGSEPEEQRRVQLLKFASEYFS